MNKIESFNRTLFLQINAGEGTADWLIRIATFIANDLIYLLPLLLLGMWLWGDSMRRSQAARAGLVTVLALGVNLLIGLIWPYPRPFAQGLGHVWIYHAADPSFPSDHATVFAGIGLALLCSGASGLGAAVLATGVAVAWARIFLGVHFPLDMLGAVAVTSAVCLVVSPLWRVRGDTLIHLMERLYRSMLARPIAWGWCRH